MTRSDVHRRRSTGQRPGSKPRLRRSRSSGAMLVCGSSAPLAPPQNPKRRAAQETHRFRAARFCRSRRLSRCGAIGRRHERHVSEQNTRRQNMKKTNLQPIEFSCHAPEAQAVFVAGTFNDWRAEATPLRRQADGHWRTTLPLRPGHHEFKFIVDGQWCCEAGCQHEYHGCPKCCANAFGTMNRVLEVS